LNVNANAFAYGSEGSYHDPVVAVPGQQALGRLLDKVGDELVRDRDEGQRLDAVQDEGEEPVLEAKLRERGARGERHAEAVDGQSRRELAAGDAELEVLEVGNPVHQHAHDRVERSLVEREREAAPADPKVRLVGRRREIRRRGIVRHEDILARGQS